MMMMTMTMTTMRMTMSKLTTILTLRLQSTDYNIINIKMIDKNTEQLYLSDIIQYTM